MPVYEYTALNAKGKTLSGIIDADGGAAARQKIRAAGNFPVTLREIKEDAEQKSTADSFWSQRLFTRVRPAEVTVMTRQLATLISSGFPLVSALEALMGQVTRPGLKKTIARIKADIVEGSSFAAALGKYPHIFSPIYINMVQAGETSGTLEIVLLRLAEITERQQALQSRVVTAMIYPIMIICIGVLILVFLFIYVIPNITSIFKDMHQELPLPTQLLMGASEVLKSFWWLLCLLAVAVPAALRALRRNPRGNYWSDKTILRLPLFGDLSRKLAAARFARTLGSLLENGVSMLPSMDIVRNIVGNLTIAEVVEEAKAEVGKGQPLGKALDVKGAFPPLMIQMVQVGEQSGNLEEMLTKVADAFEREVETTLMRLTALLEPVMVLLMAGMVLFIILAIFLPMLEMRMLVR